MNQQQVTVYNPHKTSTSKDQPDRQNKICLKNLFFWLAFKCL